MWDYLPALLVGILYTIYQTRNKQEKTQFTRFYFGCIAFGIFGIPLYEELVFRYALRHVLFDIPYSLYINALMFGLVHTSNALLIKMTPGEILIHVVFTSYLGWILLHRGFWWGYALHGFHNGTIYLIRAIVQVYINRNLPAPPTRTLCTIGDTQYHYVKKRRSSLTIPRDTDIIIGLHKRIDAKFLPKGSDKLDDFIYNRPFSSTTFKPELFVPDKLGLH